MVDGYRQRVVLGDYDWAVELNSICGIRDWRGVSRDVGIGAIWIAVVGGFGVYIADGGTDVCGECVGTQDDW